MSMHLVCSQSYLKSLGLLPNDHITMSDLQANTYISFI